MRDSEVVASIVAGDQDGLAEAYDKYADPLYQYSLSLLGDPAGAADAVQDTFVVAAARLSGLADPDMFRPWLYAVARNECLRMLGSGKPARPAGRAPVGSADGADAAGDTAEAGLRALLADAAGGLDPADREVVELELWHGLTAAEIAAVLGISHGRAQSRMSRAGQRLQTRLSALAGPSPDAAVRTADEAVLAAAAESLRLAPGPPAELKAHTLALAAGHDPSAVAYRAVLFGLTGSFGPDGFPKPTRGPLPGSRHGGGKGSGAALLAGSRHDGGKGSGAALLAGSRHDGGKGGGAVSPSAGPRHAGGVSRRQKVATAGAVVALAAVIAGIAVALTRGAAPATLAARTQPTVLPTGSGTGAPGASTPAVTPGQSGGVASRTPRPARSASASPSDTTPASSPPVSSPTPSPSPTTPSPTPTTASPTATPSPTPSATKASPTTSPTPSSSSGTVAVTPAGGNLQMQQGGANITLTARGGPVTWSITVSGGDGFVWFWPRGGPLKAGQSVQVTIMAHHASGRQLTVSPGGTVFTIVSGGGGQQSPSVGATWSHWLPVA